MEFSLISSSIFFNIWLEFNTENKSNFKSILDKVIKLFSIFIIELLVFIITSLLYKFSFK